MKKTLSKLLAIFLALCLLLPTFLVFASAEEGDEEEKEDLKIAINRTFDEGWDHTNGMGTVGGAAVTSLDYVLGYDLKYNYFYKVECRSDGNDYFAFSAGHGSNKKGYTFLEFDFMSSEDCRINQFIQGMTNDSGSGKYVGSLIGYGDDEDVNAGQLMVLGSIIPQSEFHYNPSEWISAKYRFDFSYDEKTAGVADGTYEIVYTLTQGEESYTGTVTKTVAPGCGGLKTFRIGYKANANPRRLGQWYALDNFKLYTGCNEFKDLDPNLYGYGSLVNANTPKNYPLLSGSSTQTGLSREQALAQGLFMKLNVEYGLDKGVKVPLLEDEDGNVYGAPVKYVATDAAYEKYNGEIMIPLQPILDYIGYPVYHHVDGGSFDISTGTSATYITIGRDTATVGGKLIKLTAPPQLADDGVHKYPVVALSDVEELFPGYYVTYDNMGIICLCTAPDVFNRATDLEWMCDVMKEFIFDYATPEEVIERVETTTNNYTHPYLYANQDRFDELHAAYLLDPTDPEYDEYLWNLLDSYVTSANNICFEYEVYDNNDAKYTGERTYVGANPAKLPKEPNPDTVDGYDPYGGRFGVPDKDYPQTLGFAYQITRNLDYVRCLYEYVLAVGKLNHWGPGHFLNCAGAAMPIATGIDWAYNGFAEAGLDVKDVIDELWEHGTQMGYLAALEESCPFPSIKVGAGGFVYHKKTNNWNAVCTAGMTISSLVTMSDPDYRQQSAYTISDGLYYLPNYGLSEYAPDGSYCESASYWSYGTNNFFQMCAALVNAAGTDFGLMDTWGIDNTCYYATYTEDNDMKMWTYHDGSSGAQNTQWFTWVGAYLGDYDLCRIRRDQLAAGKNAIFVDAIYYDLFDNEEVHLPLDYYMEGIGAFSVRSSWEQGAMFVGIMGGEQEVSHGQKDQGAFVYHNEGIIWIRDLGGDDYNLHSYFGTFNYYKRNAEGNNCLVYASDPEKFPFGQAKSCNVPIVERYSNEYGAYAILDMYEAYAGPLYSAKRGLYVTNDRKTVVIQDEACASGFETMYWVAHYSTKTIKEFEIKDNGKTVYMTAEHPDKGYITLRISLVSNGKSDKFVDISTYEDYDGVEEQYLLEKTYKSDSHIEKGGVAQDDRSEFRRLVVKCRGMGAQLAVVMEIVDRENEIPVGYQWTPMKDWSKAKNLPSRDTRLDGDDVELGKGKRDKAQFNRVDQYLVQCGVYRDHLNTSFTDDLVPYYKSITDLTYNYIEFIRDNIFTSEQVSEYERYTTEYDKFVTDLNESVRSSSFLVNRLIGR